MGQKLKGQSVEEKDGWGERKMGCGGLGSPPPLCDLAEPFISALTEQSHIERGEQEGRVMSSVDCYQPQQWPSPWPLLKSHILLSL